MILRITSAQFFSIVVGKLLGPADLLLEKDSMILIISSGVTGQKKKDFKILSFSYVIGDFFFFRNSFCNVRSNIYDEKVESFSYLYRIEK